MFTDPLLYMCRPLEVHGPQFGKCYSSMFIIDYYDSYNVKISKSLSYCTEIIKSMLLKELFVIYKLV